MLIDMGAEKQQLEREPESERETEGGRVCEKDQREGGRRGETERKAEQVEQAGEGKGRWEIGEGLRGREGQMERRWVRRA